MRTLDDAMREVVAAFAPTETRRVPLADALGLALAQPLDACLDAPAFDNSAMDGFAVRAADVAEASVESPVELPLATESRAGGPWPLPLPEGHAAPIFTGAPLPEGADAIVVREDATRGEAHVLLRHPSPVGHHVRRRGEDLRVGMPLAEAGDVVDAGLLALLASQTHAEVEVHRRPKVAVLVTGDELREGAPDERGTIVDSNGPMLSALLREAGAEPIVLPRGRDTLEELTESVRAGLEGADLLVTTGGVSVGDHDHVRAALEAAGVELAFWKVALKPGKPLVFGTRAGRGAALGLPGNPVSAFVTFHLFVRPVVRTLLGDACPWPALRRARLAEAVQHSIGRTELIRSTVEMRDDGEWVRALPRQGSGALASLGAAEAMIVLPAETARLETGDVVWLWPLRGGAERLPTLA
ncbi:MAG: molybdopterin molybdotransferase MoeA [Sandaracinus sp.]|nr:molybdopterin molybdotransferase MoeA [Sandaracinus sp.]